MGYPKKRSYPKKLLLGNQEIGFEEWIISFKRRVEKDGKTLGICDPSDMILAIKMGQTDEESFQTLIHEMLHAIEHTYQIEISHSLIYKLEVAFSDIFINNFMKIK